MDIQERRLQLLIQIREGQLQNVSVYSHAEINGDVQRYFLLRNAFDKGEVVSESIARLFEDLQLLQDAYDQGLIYCHPSPPRYDSTHRITDINNIRLTRSGEMVLESPSPLVPVQIVNPPTSHLGKCVRWVVKTLWAWAFVVIGAAIVYFVVDRYLKRRFP